jgi:hypothetical protein
MSDTRKREKNKAGELNEEEKWIKNGQGEWAETVK